MITLDVMFVCVLRSSCCVDIVELCVVGNVRLKKMYLMFVAEAL